MNTEVAALSNRKKKKLLAEQAAAATLAEKNALILARAKDSALQLLDALKKIASNDEYETEYDGRMMSMCHDCGDLERSGEHREGCDYAQARALIASIEGAA